MNLASSELWCMRSLKPKMRCFLALMMAFIADWRSNGSQSSANLFNCLTFASVKLNFMAIPLTVSPCCTIYISLCTISRTYAPPLTTTTDGEFSFRVASCNNSVSTSIGLICTYRTTLPRIKQFFNTHNCGYRSLLTMFTDVSLIFKYWSTLWSVPVRTTSFLSSTAISFPTNVLKKE